MDSLLQKSLQSIFSCLVRIPYCNVIAIVLAEMRTRQILREKAGGKQTIEKAKD